MSRDTAARVANLCDLRPPLRHVFAQQWDARVLEVPVVAGGRTYLADPAQAGALTAIDNSTNRMLWCQPKVGSASLFHNRRLVCISSKGLRLVDPETGMLEGMFAFLDPFGSAAVGDQLFAVSYVKRSHVVHCGDFTSQQETWRWSRRDASIRCLFAATPDALCFGLEDGPVLALDPRTGRELWSHSLADLRHPANPNPDERVHASGTTVIHEGRVLFEADGFGAVAYSVTDGRRLWAQPCGTPMGASLYAGRYYVLNVFGLFVMDPATGAILSEKKLVVPPLGGEEVMPRYPLQVTETHIFTGSREGYVLAFDRESGEFVWSDRPKGAGSNAGFEFASANGRLYYCDTSCRMHCLEYDAAGETKLARDVAARQQQRAKTLGGLGFEIVAVHQGQVVTKKRPYYQPGGGWTVLECRTLGPKKGVFFLAEDGTQLGEGEAVAWSKAALWVPTLEDGKAVVEDYRKTFMPHQRVNMGKPTNTTPPAFFRTAVLATDPGWRRLKWWTEDEAEFFMRWNLEGKQGALTEKDEGFRIDVLDALACLLK